MRVVKAPDVEEVDLPQLRAVGGDVLIGDVVLGHDPECPLDDDFTDCVLLLGNPSLTELHLPALESVGGRFHIAGNDVLLDVDAAQPFTVGRDLLVTTNAKLTHLTLGVTSARRLVSVDDNVALVQVHLPLLTEVVAEDPYTDDDLFRATTYGEAKNGSLYVYTSAFDGLGDAKRFQEVESLELPVLRRLDGALILCDLVMADVTLPELTTAHSLLLLTNFAADLGPHPGQGMQTFSAPLLTSVTGDGTRFFRTSRDGFGFTNCDGGVSLCLEANLLLRRLVIGAVPSLAAGLTIEDNSALVDVCALDGLADVGPVNVYRNDALPTFSFLAGLRTVRGELNLSDNDGAPNCEAAVISAQCTGETAVDLDDNRATGDCTTLPVCSETLP